MTRFMTPPCPPLGHSSTTLSHFIQFAQSPRPLHERLPLTALSNTRPNSLFLFTLLVRARLR